MEPIDTTPITFNNTDARAGIQAGYLTNTGVILNFTNNNDKNDNDNNDSNNSNNNNKTNNNNAAQDQSEKDGLKVLNTLYTYASRSGAESQKDRNPDRVDGTCEWFTSHQNFQDWITNPSKILWVSADPGSGKSVLAKYLVDSALRTTESRTTCYFFFKDALDAATSATALCCILFQLFDQKRSLLSKGIIERFKIAGKGLCSSFKELWNVFLAATKNKSAGEVVCILDALDECRNDDRFELMTKLQQLYSKPAESNLKFLITSRPIPEIRSGFHRHKIPASLIHLSGESDIEREKITKEIDIFIEHRVQEIGEILDLTSKERTSLLQALRSVPNRTYLWVHLTLNLIESNPGTYIDLATGEDRMHKITSYLPKTVNEAYEKILSTSSDLKEKRLLLQILVAAARPLRLFEMIVAIRLAGKKDCHSYKKLRPILRQPEERIRDYIQDLCSFFVVVIDSTVYLIHQTAKEFLVGSKEPERTQDGGRIWRNSLQESDCHQILFEACVRYLYLAEFEYHARLLSRSVSKYVRKYIFLDYSASHWAAHFRNAQFEFSKGTLNEVLKLCDVDSTRFLTWFKVYWTTTNTEFPRGMSTLMVASYFGLRSVVSLLLQYKPGRKVSVNAVDDTYKRSALSWASGNGFADVVSELLKTRYRKKILFLKRGAKVNRLDRYRRTPLTYAVWGDHTLVIEQLLQAGALTNIKDEIGGTAISYSICSGRNNIFEKLLGHTASDGPNSKDSMATELLFSAIGKDRDDVVKMLLEITQVNLKSCHRRGDTPLRAAMPKRNYRIIQLLLENGADAKGLYSADKTMLEHAVDIKSPRMVRLLLKHGALDQDLKPHGWMSLVDRVQAKWNNRIARLVLESAGATHQTQGRTPLTLAAEWGLTETAQLLLERGAAVDAVGDQGRTPLFAAAEGLEGKEEIVKLLLERGAAVDAVDDQGRTPLFAAAKGKEEIVKLLLERGAAVDAVDNQGRTPLFAAAKGKEEIVKLLLDKGANIEATDKGGHTPLFWAMDSNMWSASTICYLLIAAGASIKTRAVDGEPYSFLYRATDKNNKRLAELLIDKGADIEEWNKRGPTPLFYALRCRAENIAVLLLQKGARTEVKGTNNKTLRVNLNSDSTASDLSRVRIEVQDGQNAPWTVISIIDIVASDYIP